MKISFISSLLVLLLLVSIVAGDTAGEDHAKAAEVDVVEEATATSATGGIDDDGSGNDSNDSFYIRDDTSILDYLDPAIINDSEIIKEIQYNLQAGNLIVLKDAFLPEFAELAWSEMYSDDRIWKPFKTIRKNGHNFFKHRPTDRREGTINQIRNVFKHVKSREFFTMLSGRDCMSEREFSAL